jgi:hypothetical protein
MPGDDTEGDMTYRILGFALRHRAVVAAMVLTGLLVNLVVIGTAESRSGDSLDNLPAAAQCHGGGAGCAEQPLIPPPAIGMPRVSDVAPISFGVPALVQERVPPTLVATPPHAIERPPLPAAAA